MKIKGTNTLYNRDIAAIYKNVISEAITEVWRKCFIEQFIKASI